MERIYMTPVGSAMTLAIVAEREPVDIDVALYVVGSLAGCRGWGATARVACEGLGDKLTLTDNRRDEASPQAKRDEARAWLEQMAGVQVEGWNDVRRAWDVLIPHLN